MADKQKKFQEAKEMRENLNWAVLGTGVIANEMAQALQKMGKSLYAVGNRTHQKAIDFAEKYGVGKVYDRSMICLRMKMLILFILPVHITHIMPLWKKHYSMESIFLSKNPLH